MHQCTDFEYFGVSDIGLVRSNNEDFWQVNLRSRVVAVADGMGGRLGGAVASYKAVTNLMRLIDANRRRLQRFKDDEYRKMLNVILSKVNDLIYQQGMMEKSLRGMGTTLSFLHLLRRDKAWLFHVGDSRVYRLRHGKLLCLTEDHSLANYLVHRYRLFKQSPKVYPYRHILTNVVGCRPYIIPDIREVVYEKGDMFVLCSDGLTNMVSEHDIRDILVRSSSLEASGRALISLANLHGGADNATVVLIRIR